MSNAVSNTKKERQPLLKNTIIFAIGTIFTKVISIVMVPLYTFILTQAEYGTIDILSNTANLITPIFTIAIAESVLRFSLSKDANHKQVFTTGLLVYLAGLVVMLISMFITSRFIYTEYTACVLVFFALEMAVPFLQYFMKGIGKTIHFVISSVLYALFSTTAIILFLRIGNLSVKGYFWGMCIGVAVFIIYCFFSCKLWKYFSFKNLSKKTAKGMILYSLPLIASNVSYWIISASDIYVTKIIMGEEANGILAVVRKIPSLISLVYGIFISAFSLNSISDHNFLESKENDERAFYEKNFNRGISLICFALAALSLIIEPLSRVIFSKDFYEAWQYVPSYSVGIGLGCFANYLEVIFKVTKKTRKIMICTVVSAIINLTTCILLMKYTPLGLYAASISTLASQASVFILFLILSQKDITIKIKWNLWIAISLTVIQSLIPIFNFNAIAYWITESIFFVVILGLTSIHLFETAKALFNTIFKKQKNKTI